MTFKKLTFIWVALCVFLAINISFKSGVSRDLFIILIIALTPCLGMLWKRLGEPNWLRLPKNVRKGIIRLYVAMVIPWTLWFAYKVYDDMQHWNRQRQINADLLWLISLPVGIVATFIVAGWVVDGFRSSSSETEASFNSENTSEMKSNQPVSIDFVEVGKLIAASLLQHDECWKDVSKLHGYNVPDSIAAIEMFFARAAVVLDTIQSIDKSDEGQKIQLGVKQFIHESFSKVECTDEIKFYYQREAQGAMALEILDVYEKYTSSLNRLSEFFESRISVSCARREEITALLQEVAAETKRMMKFSITARRTRYLLDILNG